VPRRRGSPEAPRTLEGLILPRRHVTLPPKGVNLDDNERLFRSAPREFTTTRWSVVLRAGENDPQTAIAALEQLARAYWYPLYAFVRRKGHSSEDAADLTQDFFAKLLRADFLAGLDPKKGRFRSFLLTALNHFLIDEWKRIQTHKRGGGRTVLSLDADIGEEGELKYEVESRDAGPEKLFDKTWAERILQTVLHRLEQECLERKDARFMVLRPFLAAGDDPPALLDAATQLGLNLAGFKSLLHRFRKRYRELLLEEIGQTVNSDADLEVEIRELMAALRAD
jgi:RNA polymerase sigma factor (sigma-70 family)